MFNIEGLLKKFKNMVPPDDHVKNIITLAVFEKIKLEIDKKKIKIINGVAYIDASPSVKSVIFRNKTGILKETGEKLGKNTPINDIR